MFGGSMAMMNSMMGSMNTMGQQQQYQRYPSNNNNSRSIKKPRRYANHHQQSQRYSQQEYNDKALQTIPGEIFAFSGCQDDQTSADVHDVTSFGLPTVSGAEKAGGACTNALLSTLQKSGQNITYGNLLLEMRRVLKQRGYKQVPALSTSHATDLCNERFSLENAKYGGGGSGGNKKALLVGINYVGHNPGELSGCVNDQKMIYRWLGENGWPTNDQQKVRYLTDDSNFSLGSPTLDNIKSAMKWLVQGAKAGDTLFFSYSGHGSQVPDTSGDEPDGKDETLVPLDYKSAGHLIDDEIFKLLVATVPQGVKCIYICDCCHSQSLLDLSYVFEGNTANAAKLEQVAQQLQQQQPQQPYPQPTPTAQNQSHPYPYQQQPPPPTTSTSTTGGGGGGGLLPSFFIPQNPVFDFDAAAKLVQASMQMMRNVMDTNMTMMHQMMGQMRGGGGGLYSMGGGGGGGGGMSIQKHPNYHRQSSPHHQQRSLVGSSSPAQSATTTTGEGGGGALSPAAAAYRNMPQRQQRQIRHAFEMWDASGDGFLDKNEAMAAAMQYWPHVSPSELLERIKRADCVNRDGKLSVEEFAILVDSVAKEEIFY